MHICPMLHMIVYMDVIGDGGDVLRDDDGEVFIIVIIIMPVIVKIFLFSWGFDFFDDSLVGWYFAGRQLPSKQ